MVESADGVRGTKQLAEHLNQPRLQSGFQPHLGFTQDVAASAERLRALLAEQGVQLKFVGHGAGGAKAEIYAMLAGSPQWQQYCAEGADADRFVPGQVKDAPSRVSDFRRLQDSAYTPRMQQLLGPVAQQIDLSSAGERFQLAVRSCNPAFDRVMTAGPGNQHYAEVVKDLRERGLVLRSKRHLDGDSPAGLSEEMHIGWKTAVVGEGGAPNVGEADAPMGYAGLRGNDQTYPDLLYSLSLSDVVPESKRPQNWKSIERQSYQTAESLSTLDLLQSRFAPSEFFSEAAERPERHMDGPPGALLEELLSPGPELRTTSRGMVERLTRYQELALNDWGVQKGLVTQHQLDRLRALQKTFDDAAGAKTPPDHEAGWAALCNELGAQRGDEDEGFSARALAALKESGLVSQPFKVVQSEDFRPYTEFTTADPRDLLSKMAYVGMVLPEPER